MGININECQDKGLPEMLSNILDFFQEYPNGNFIFICGESESKDGGRHAITGAIANRKELELLLTGMFSTTVYVACDKSYFEVVQLLKCLTYHIIDKFTLEDRMKLVRELDKTLDKLIEETDGE